MNDAQIINTIYWYFAFSFFSAAVPMSLVWLVKLIKRGAFGRPEFDDIV